MNENKLHAIFISNNVFHYNSYNNSKNICFIMQKLFNDQYEYEKNPWIKVERIIVILQQDYEILLFLNDIMIMQKNGL